MTKKVNYTPEQVATLLAGYDAKASAEDREAQVAALAIALDKKVSSIRAKLSSEKVYVAKVYTNKQGGESIRKGAIVTLIAGAMGESEESLDTLVKANKTVLETIWNFVKPEEAVADENDSQEADVETA